MDDLNLPVRREDLARRVTDLIAAGVDGDPHAFDGLAHELFSYQYDANEPYRRFCRAAGASPDTVGDWRDIPAYPTQAFKDEIVASFPMDQAVMAQLTSGTTSANQRGRIFRDELGRELVFSANRAMTAGYVFPDFEAGRRCRILILAPSPQMAPSMGMAIGMERTREHFGATGSRFLLTRTGIDVKALVAALREAEDACEPVALIGATSAFVYFLRACERKGLRFALPAGSRLIDGGGYRGRFGEVTRDDYYALAADRLGIPAHHCVNTLGMAESATNYSDRVLRDRVLGLGDRPRRKTLPPWARVRVIDPDTGAECAAGDPGLLVHYDLVNVPTVLGVQTDNLGFLDEDGSFEIIGRAKVVDGQVSELPSERSVGPMGEKRVFRLLEAYVNFSIDFKMGRLASSQPKTDYVEERAASEVARGGDPETVAPSCPVVVDDLVAAAYDPAAARAAEKALGIFEE